MRVEVKDGATQRRILIGMIVDSTVLGAIAPKWEKPGAFEAKWANMVANWCIKYYHRHAKAPGMDIVSLFERWSEEGDKDRDTVKSIEKFLSSLSDEYKQLKKGLNSKYLIDLAGKYFNDVRTIRLSTDIRDHVQSGEIDKALKKISNFGRIEIGSKGYIDPLRDKSAMKRVFTERLEPIIRYDGDAGKFLNGQLTRDSLIAIEATEKKGKTWLALEFIWTALEQRKRVAFFEVGDLSEEQIMERFAIRATGLPIEATTINYPKSIKHDPDEIYASVIHKHKKLKALNYSRAKKSMRQFIKNRIKSKEEYFRLEVHPSNSVTILDIMSTLQQWARKGWVPDVIAIDYPDILAPISATVDSRDQINATWMKMRAISQTYHCCLLAPTQANAKAYGAYVIGMEHFGNDKRKRGHVTASLAINQTEQEKELDLFRFNWVVARSRRYSLSKCLFVAGCLDIAQPIIRSTL